MNQPKFYLSYPEAAMTYKTSVRTLSKLVASGILTRNVSSKDSRKVLLSVEELTDHFQGHDKPIHPEAA